MSINIHLLKLNEEDNKDYYDLYNRGYSLIESYDKINNKLHNISKCFNNIFKVKRLLKEVEIDLKEYLKFFIKWNGDIDNYLLKPNIIVESPDNPNLAFMHFMNNLYYLKNRLLYYDSILYSNYNVMYSKYEGKINYWIALCSFVIAIVGLFISIYPLLFC